MRRSLLRALPLAVILSLPVPLATAGEGAWEPVDVALQRAQAAVDEIIAVSDGDRTFENTVEAIDDLLAQLELDTNMLMFMAYVSTDPDERRAGEQAEETATNWLIDLSKNERLYEAVLAYADTKPVLEGEEARMLEHVLRDYRRAGMALTPEARAKLTEIQKEITGLGIEFDSNIRDDETRVPLTGEELAGMGEEFLAGLERSGDIYLVGMSYPEFLPIMDYCEDETTRKKVWLAYKRRGGRKNVEVLERMIKLRAEAATLLGYDSAADYETEIKMAKNAASVAAFYEKLRPLVREKALLDHAEFTDAERRYTGNPEAVLEPWDFSFYQNILKKEKYAVDTEKVREYFPIERVIGGLFSITQTIYGIEYRDVTEQAESKGHPIWHPDVKFYEVWDIDRDEMLGAFYVDLHPRANKYGHAAQWGLAQHKVWSDGSVTRPLAALVCNFTKPTADKPSLLTHDEVETFFHEFGHCLHTILSDAELWRFSGTSVERDFVEAPSQMFENWIWDADVLRTFARHYETGEPFPDDLLEGMMAARHLGSGMLAEHQFYYGLIDLAYHTAPDGEVDTTEVGLDLFTEVELYPRIPGTFFQASFGHMTGYQAGYYGYQWSLVYASDMFQRFKELGMLDPEAGRYYRRTILGSGGTKDGPDLVRDYLGRDPDMTAYLKHLGLSGE